MLMSKTIKWLCKDRGWHVALRGSDCVAAITLESAYDCPPGRRWCAYITKDMPPGDKQFKTLAEARRWVNKRLGANRATATKTS